MARKQSPNLTDAELRVMGVLWDKGEATVRDVTDALARKHKLAYTTVLTVLRVLTEKGFVAADADARAHVFKPLLSREEARARAVSLMVASFFGGSHDALAQHLIEEDVIDVDALRRMETAASRRGPKRD
ncbi:transcriptional repressor of BlaI/MecI family [alpha proteobacterium U9-1i]|nr:transcriptional repressor of BlaI/MecI family [alpha proteobacterium U9-1i]